MVETKIVPSKPALILEGKTKNLIVTDLHIGFESNLTQNDIFVGKNTTIHETIDELCGIIESVKPDSLILLGDIKSSIKFISKNEWDEVPLFFKKLKEKVDVFLIPGNHDGNIQKLVPNGITLVSPSGLVIENSLLTHGHVMPPQSIGHVNRIIMGHIHPIFFQEGSLLNGKRVWVSIKADKQKIFPEKNGVLEITVVPSFNKYFSANYRGQNKKSISPIIEKTKEISSAKIVALDGTILGNESIIKMVI